MFKIFRTLWWVLCIPALLGACQVHINSYTTPPDRVTYYRPVYQGEVVIPSRTWAEGDRAPLKYERGWWYGGSTSYSHHEWRVSPRGTEHWGWNHRPREEKRRGPRGYHNPRVCKIPREGLLAGQILCVPDYFIGDPWRYPYLVCGQPWRQPGLSRIVRKCYWGQIR